ncbi:uncharacterized protein ARMOST_21551 [Armillaria ostoyae]|uniref:Uncharacterized protein n=1 Tax=Armillaria ostoyae TaxID=47428 RepID=A0A284SAD9_ARMOS|nr:uncharacterized protein ARMOST_21551 [Armillaria ostoyae]
MRSYRVQAPPPSLPPAKFATTYPAFASGSARRDSLVASTHVIDCTAAPLSRLSRVLSEAQTVLYSDLDMRDIWNHNALWIFLITRRDLTPLAHTLRVPAWSSAQARAYLIRPQTNIVSLRFPIILLDDNDNSVPSTPLPATPTHTRLLSLPTTSSRLSPPPLPPTPIRNQDAFMHTATTLFPNLANLHGSPYLIILAPFRPLINLLITISILIYAGFRPTTILKYLPHTLYCLRFMFKSVGKRTKEKTLRTAVDVCSAIEELEIEGEGGEKCWCSILSHFNSLRVLIMRIPRTAQVETAKEELNESVPLQKQARTCSTLATIIHSGHLMVVSQCWHRSSLSLPVLPRSRSSPSLNLIMKKIDRVGPLQGKLFR